MSSKTTNYKLHKIDLTDAPPDITVINPNWDTIDTQLKNLSDSISTKPAVTVDSALSTTSTNPVQNKVITAELNKKSESGHKHTAEELGAVKKAGDTMTGDLLMEGDDTAVWFKNASIDRECILSYDTNTKEFFVCNKKTNDYYNLVNLALAAQDASVDELLTLYHVNGGVAHTYKVLHTGNMNELITGVAKIQTGSYTGAHKYGASTPNSVALTFVPKFFYVFRSDLSPNSQYSTLRWVTGFTDTNSNTKLRFSVSGNTLSWYSETSPDNQMNASKTNYYWVAIG